MIRLAALATVLLLTVPAWAADDALRGVALVIGESKYEALTPLPNPTQDARAIDDLLNDLGFDVERVLNADADRLRDAIADFIADAEDADVALVYYSGHGIEVAGENYLIPIDTDLATPESAGGALVPVAPLLDALARAVPVTIVLLDACRSDPFPAGTVVRLPGEAAPMTISAEGLAAVRGPTPLARPDADPLSLGAVIGFAAEPGQPALDGAPGENSPYAAALLKHLGAGGFSFGDVMTMVGEEVYLKTRAQQLPWTNSSLRRVLTFAAPAPADPDQSAITAARRTLLLSIATTPPETRGYVEALAGEEDVPLDALYGMLDVLGVRTDGSGAELIEQLQKGAEKLKELMAQRAVAVKADAELERLSRLADQAEAEGAIALALDYRNQASGRADALLIDRQAEAARLREDMVDIAATYAANAATALLNFDHAAAAALYGKAYAAVSGWDAGLALAFKLNEANALADRGYYTTDNDALVAALAAYDEALALAPRATHPADWARLQDLVGQASQVLGARLSDPATLEASVGFYQAALEVRTRDAAPADWAKTQNNLANALYTLGERNGDSAEVRAAVAAFDAALGVFTAEAEPVRWATISSNRGAAQLKLAELVYMATDGLEMAAAAAGNPDPTNIPEVVAARAEANAEIEKAISSLEKAVDSSAKADNPLDWAMLEHTLAGAIEQRGVMNKSAEDMRRAADMFHEVLTVHTRERMPAQWVRTSNNLAISLKKLSEFAADPAPLHEAVAIYREVVAATPRENLPLDWADYQQNLGNALGALADYEEPLVHLEAALAAYRAAGEITTFERGAGKWQQLQTAIGTTLLMQSLKGLDPAKAEESRAVALAARDRLRAAGVPDDGFYDMFLPMIDQVLELLPVLANGPPAP